MNDAEVAFETIAKQRERLERRELSSVELTELAIRRIEHLDTEINAVVVRDFERALLAARDADSARARGANGPSWESRSPSKSPSTSPGYPPRGAFRPSGISSPQTTP
jgi:hypothetical protein